MTNIYSSYEAAIEAGAKGTDLVREECENCDKGNKPWFAHVHDGVCFQCHGRAWFTVQVRSIKARERRAAKRQAQQAEEIAAREEAIAARKEWNTEHPEFVAALKALVAAKVSFAVDIADLQEIPTENQIAAILRVHAEHIAKAEAEIDVPEGRQTVTGRVISYKLVDNHFSYHGGTTVKILVEDPRGFRIYGTAPAALLNDRDANELKGTEVEFTATLEGKEKGFGFFKRPTKAQFV